MTTAPDDLVPLPPVVSWRVQSLTGAATDFSDEETARARWEADQPSILQRTTLEQWATAEYAPLVTPKPEPERPTEPVIPEPGVPTPEEAPA